MSKNSPGAHDGRSRRGRAGGTKVLGFSPAQQTDRQKRLELNLRVREGYTRCPECGKEIRLRKDGTMMGHRSQSTIPCIGAKPR